MPQTMEFYIDSTLSPPAALRFVLGAMGVGAEDVEWDGLRASSVRELFRAVCIDAAETVQALGLTVSRRIALYYSYGNLTQRSLDEIELLAYRCTNRLLETMGGDMLLSSMEDLALVMRRNRSVQVARTEAHLLAEIRVPHQLVDVIR